MANPFSNIFSKILSGAAGSSGDSVLGIDIGSASIKVVQLKKQGGRAVLETYGALYLGPYGGVEIGRATNLSSTKVAEALSDLLKEAKTTTKNCALSIPVSSSLITFIDMPMANQKQLSQMVPIEARKYIPVPISEVTLDWMLVPKEDSFTNETSDSTGSNPTTPTTPTTPQKIEKSEVLLVVIHNDAITKVREVASGAVLKQTFFEIETFSTIRSSLEQGLAPIMIMDFGASSTKLYIVERGLLRDSHIINRGSQDITLAISKSLGISISEAENLKREHGMLKSDDNKPTAEMAHLTTDSIFAEANRVLLNFQKRQNKNVNRLILSGGGSLLKGLVEMASVNFQIAVELADPFAKVQTPAFLENVLQTAGPEFTIAIGLALRKLQENG